MDKKATQLEIEVSKAKNKFWDVLVMILYI